MAGNTTWYNAIASQESDDLVKNSGGGCGSHQTSASLDGYSELMNNTGLGTIPCDTEMYIKANGKTIKARKVDSGGGSSFNPQMGLYPRVSQYLFGTINGGEFHVQIQRVDGQPINIVGGSTGTGPPGSDTSGGGGTSNRSSGGGSSPGDQFNIDRNTDYWAGCSSLAQQAQLYFFSEAETMYLIDGKHMVAQQPCAILDRSVTGTSTVHGVTRFGIDSIPHMQFSYDNSAFSGTSTHRRKGKNLKQTSLAKVQSPTSGSVDLICPIDYLRAGDTVLVNGAGFCNGIWVLGDVTRSVFGVQSSLSLVPAMAPLPEYEVAGAGTGSAGGGTGVSGSASIAAVVNASHVLDGLKVPYPPGDVGDTGHGPGQIANDQPKFLDCSSSTSWVLHRAGMFPSSTAIVSGEFATSWGQPGTGKQLTVWADSVHVFFEVNAPGVGHMQGNTAGPQGPGAGFRFFAWGSQSTSGFTPRHWQGL